MKILLIGNGFDLEHHLPTTYKDFLDFCQKARKIFTLSSEITTHQYCKTLADLDTAPSIITALKLSFQNRKCKQTCKENSFYTEVTTQNPALDELFELIRDNIWLQYFEKRCSCLGENWIDFESEISKVIQALEDRRSQMSNGSFKRELWDERDLLDDTLGNFNKEFKDISEEGVSSVDRFSEYLMRELERLTRALEIYLAEFVQKIPITEKSADIEAIHPDYILSFNYSNTYERVYGSEERIIYDYIHGKADLSKSVSTCNLVLGIDEYLDDDRKNIDLEFLPFKKYYQRIYKSTGNTYLDWVAQIKEDEVEYQRKLELAYRGENDPLESFPWRPRRYLNPSDIRHPEHVLYIFGHSLDITDRDVLRLLICNDNVQTKIFYYRKNKDDKSTLGKLIKNLVRIIGQDELIRRSGGAHKTIEFIPQTICDTGKERCSQSNLSLDM